MRYAIALLLGATAVGQVSLDVLQLHHMDATMGWVWSDTNQRVIGWWLILGIVNAVFAITVLLRVDLVLVPAGLWTAFFSLLWLWWAAMYVMKASRVDNPELYLFVVPGSFVLAYAGATAASTLLIRRRLWDRRRRRHSS